jgi:glycosyltransferase involved in cell wall biosynthesis
VIITKTLPPAVCGIGDHSVLLGNAIRSRGHQVTLVASSGSPGEDRCIVKDFWRRGALDGLMRKLESMGADHLILQYTPLMFAIDGKYQNFQMADFWSDCSSKWKTSIILHETYFRAWWHPPSLIKGAIEKRLMKMMMRNSNYVFTASQPLFEEIRQWFGNARIGWLPLGSHFPFHAIDRQKMKAEAGFSQCDVVLTLFSGGESLRKLSHYVNSVDALLSKNNIAARWLFLGGVKEEWFSLRLPIVSPGFLTPEDLSAWLQLTDIFLMPHISGLSAKRSTLMAALQHGLPVVGTKGPMTDPFWGELPGVVLTPMPGAKAFANSVLKLSHSEGLRKEIGEQNHLYFEQHFTWDRIADGFLGVVG